ncbi:MAG: hypothetical protein HYY61_03535 [Deltaproteobacteria bacterium]|nr:hypothetical protein [Deltaproteobacteria bacterium]
MTNKILVVLIGFMLISIYAHSTTRTVDCSQITELDVRFGYSTDPSSTVDLMFRTSQASGERHPFFKILIPAGPELETRAMSIGNNLRNCVTATFEFTDTATSVIPYVTRYKIRLKR